MYVPEAFIGTLTHCSVDMELNPLLVMRMLIESLSLLRGSSLYFHSSEGTGTAVELQIRVMMLLSSKINLSELEIVTVGESVITQRK